MSKKPGGIDPGLPALRAAAEKQCADRMTKHPAHPATESMHELLHELQVHQVELDMQNETLRQSQVSLEESRDRYINLYDFSPVGYLTLTEQGLIAEINLTGAAMLGMDRSRLLRHRFSRSVAAADQDHWHRHFADALRQDGKQTCDTTLLRPDGSRLEVSLDSQRLTREDTPSKLRVVLTDITERKRAEETLRASEQRFQDYVELSVDLYWEQDTDFRFTSMSCGVFNKDDSHLVDCLGKKRWELPIEGVSEARWAEHRGLLERHEAFQDFTYTIRAADGSLRCYSVSGKPVFATDGKFLGYRGTSRDISTQKHVEGELRASEQRFRDFAELSADWFWEQDADLRFSYISGGANSREERGGVRLTKDLGKTRWESPAEGADESRWATHRAVLARREIFNDFVYALRAVDGALRWYSVSGKPLFASDGEFLGYRGTSREITEQVCSLEKLEKTLHWLKQAVCAAGVGLWERDIATWAFSFRDNWRSLFGYAEDEIKDTAEDFDRLVHPDDLARIHAAGRAYKENPQREYEIRFRIRHKDGSWRWVLSRGNILNEALTGRRTFVGCHLDITEQMCTAQALQDSEQRFHDYADMAADWFWEQDTEFRFTHMSGGIVNKGGFRVADSLGKTRWELPIEGIDAARWAQHRALLERHEVFQDFTYTIHAADGSMHWYSISGRPVFDEAGRFAGYRGVGHDITQRVRSREQLEKTRRWLEQAVRAGRIGLWERDADTWAFGMTDNWKSLFGYAEDEIGNNAADFDRQVHPDDLARIHAKSRAYAENPQGDYENRFRIRHKNGSWRWVLSRGNLLTDATTQRRTWIGCHIDVTEQMQAEQKVVELAALLELRVKARTAELEEANRELDAFNFSVSHDLRTPLRAIEGFSRALLEDCHEQLDATGRDYLQRIGAATARMGELIEALYELSRLSRAPLQLRPVDLSALARELVAELRELDPQRRVDIEIADTPPVEGDARLLRSVLANLLGNAWKFTAKAAPARIAFDAQSDEKGCMVYSVVDNGVGFDMQFADKLFRMFHRLHREEEFAGQGVGLTTVQRVVARHGGSVWGDGERGRGASFCFTLWDDPALLAEAREAADPA